MRERVKQRIVGAVVLVALAVIFVPLLFTLEPPRAVDTASQIPPAPDIDPVPVEDPEREEGFAAPKPAEEAFLPADPVVEGTPATPAPAPGAAPAPAEARPALAGDLVEAWVIQVASFRDRQVADELVAKLLAAGHRAYVRDAVAQGATTYRVFVGPVALKSRADADKIAIDKAFGVNALVLRFTP
ncbi:MAG: SPOR domain-containing protein [Porticoccaceae bacterium]|jgi:DedD protein|nr:SPOR domain-containing protein [Porticoccaceae bacterium]